jgi:hypothetical protein
MQPESKTVPQTRRGIAALVSEGAGKIPAACCIAATVVCEAQQSGYIFAKSSGFLAIAGTRRRIPPGAAHRPTRLSSRTAANLSQHCQSVLTFRAEA